MPEFNDRAGSAIDQWGKFYDNAPSGDIWNTLVCIVCAGTVLSGIRGPNLCFGRCSWVLHLVFGLSLEYSTRRSYFTARNTVVNYMHDHFLPYITLARDHALNFQVVLGSSTSPRTQPIVGVTINYSLKLTDLALEHSSS